jgi:hypothetical protein
VDCMPTVEMVARREGRRERERGERVGRTEEHTREATQRHVQRIGARTELESSAAGAIVGNLLER